MRFLYPEFLFALLVTAVPLIIHLFNFRRIKRVYFSNVSFLKDIEQKSSAARKVKRLLLLALRMLALVFLVFAFARPYIPSAEKGHSSSGINAVSIYIDNSYSMELLNKEGTLLDEARRRAGEIASAYGVNDRFQLLTNDFEGRHQRLLDYEEFLSAVGEVKVSSMSRTLEEVTARQAEALSQERGAVRTAYLISDFQQNLFPARPLNISDDTEYRLVKLAPPAQTNISVDSAWFISPVHKAGESERLVVRLKNNSDQESQNVSIALTIDKQQKAIGSLSLPARTSRTDTLLFSGMQEGWRQGELRINDHPLTFDDTFFFSFLVRKAVSLLVINTAAPAPYIDAVYASDPFFHVTSTDAGSVNYSGLSAFPLIILNGTEKMTEGLAGQLKEYVENGGSLFVFPSVEPDLSGLNILTRILGTDYAEAISSQETRVSNVNYRHPVFRGVFDKQPNNPDLPLARKYILYGRSGRTAGEPVMSLPGRRTFLGDYRVGKGAVLLSAVSLSEESANLVRHSFFVPLMYQSAFLSLRDRPLFFTVGKNEYFDTDRINLAGNQSLKLKNETIEIIPDARPSVAGTRVFIADQVRQAGQYRLLKADSLLGYVSFNDNRAESDLSYVSGAGITGMFAGKKVKVFEPESTPLKNSIKAANNGVQLWKLCLILTLVFLAVEILLLRFYGRKD